jgi:hypothetical protein
LVLLVAAVFGRTLGFSFTGYDDPLYVSRNPHVLEGLSLEGLRYAFTTFDTGNWHPLTWLSLMADASLGGADPSFYHATNVGLHAAATLALFVFVRRATGRAVRGAFVAALFAVHPLHVESVAWIAERKDVLSAFFFFATAYAYTWYSQRPGVGRNVPVVALFALGLLAKPMLVSLPLVLLLLDVWPLGRGTSARLLLEKAPLFALAAASSAITLVAQQAAGALAPLERIALPLRFANAVVGVAVYLVKAVWPLDLAVLYPFPASGLPAWQVVCASLLVAGVTVLSLRASRSRPYLAVGWLWYLVMLAPVLGIVQVGVQARADRYTYLPLVGVFLALVWWIPDLFGAWFRPRAARMGSLALGGLALGVLVPLCWIQVGHWRDRLTLFRHMAEVVPRFAPGHLTVGSELDLRGDFAGSRASFERALRLAPSAAEPHTHLAFWHLQNGTTDEALRHAQEAVRLAPQHAEGHLALARAGEASRRSPGRGTPRGGDRVPARLDHRAPARSPAPQRSRRRLAAEGPVRRGGRAVPALAGAVARAGPCAGQPRLGAPVPGARG